MRRKLIVLAVLIAMLVSLVPVSVQAVLQNMSQYTPYQLTATLMPVDETHPYGSVDLKFSINNLPRNGGVDVQASDTVNSWWRVHIQKKIGAMDWANVAYVETATFLDEYSLGGNQYHFEQLWNESYDWKVDTIVSYRVSVDLESTSYLDGAVSPWSNVASIGIKASGWAVGGIERATGYGLVPDSIKGDFTRPITREEFAELAVKLYEVYMKTAATPVSPNPFADTVNPEVLKAFKLGIIKGVSAVAFKPKDLTNREQIAAMLNRAVAAIAPDADVSTAGAPVFNDVKSIAPYFLENVRFMSKNGFITGSSGNFNPKGTCTCEMAVIIATRVYEKYAGIAVTS